MKRRGRNSRRWTKSGPFQLAEKERRTIFIDIDRHRRSMHRRWNCGPTRTQNEQRRESNLGQIMIESIQIHNLHAHAHTQDDWRNETKAQHEYKPKYILEFWFSNYFSRNEFRCHSDIHSFIIICIYLLFIPRSIVRSQCLESRCFNLLFHFDFSFFFLHFCVVRKINNWSTSGAALNINYPKPIERVCEYVVVVVVVCEVCGDWHDGKEYQF